MRSTRRFLFVGPVLASLALVHCGGSDSSSLDNGDAGGAAGSDGGNHAGTGGTGGAGGSAGNKDAGSDGAAANDAGHADGAAGSAASDGAAGGDATEDTTTGADGTVPDTGTPDADAAAVDAPTDTTHPADAAPDVSNNTDAGGGDAAAACTQLGTCCETVPLVLKTQCEAYATGGLAAQCSALQGVFCSDAGFPGFPDASIPFDAAVPDAGLGSDAGRPAQCTELAQCCATLPANQASSCTTVSQFGAAVQCQALRAAFCGDAGP